MTEEWLVSFDTDRIKDYVFATDRLREIRGGSLLLTALNKPLSELGIRQEGLRYREVFFAGGSGATVVPTLEDAQQLISAVEKLYLRRTYTASITGVAVPIPPSTDGSGFLKAMDLAALKLRERKDEKAQRLLAGIEPYIQPCSACERYPAVCVSELDKTPVCAACEAKRKKIYEYRMNQEEEGSFRPDELSELGEISRPRGYIGFIYADGNNMGEWLKQSGGEKEYGAFARNLDKLIKDKLDGILSKRNHPPRPLSHSRKIDPYEILLVGGDDMMFVTAGDIALSTALELAAEFEEGSSQVLSSPGRQKWKKLTLGMAIVLAHSTFPIAALHRLAQQLLKRAKQCCSLQEYRSSAIDFMVVTAAGSSDLNAIRDEVLTQDSFIFSQSDREVRLTQRPYLLDDAQDLFAHLKKIKTSNIPRSQLQFLYEGLFHSQAQATYRWIKVASRLGDEHKAALANFYARFGDSKIGLPPWKRENNPPGVDYSTALGDLIEIYPFVSN